MNYLTFILTVALCFGFTDFLTERYPRLQRDIWYIAFSIIAFLCTIKYYYGPDVANYVPFWDNVPSVSNILAHPDEILYHFEPGYAIFCRLLKDWGLSFYWHTAIISILYFAVIAILFSKINSKRSFALSILMVLDYNIILYEYRQCLSVVAFLLMILLLGKKNYLWALVCAIIAITCHKAGAMVVIPTILFYFFSQNIVPRSIFAILLVALALMLLLPVTNISIDFLSLLPFSRTALHSIEHHLMIGKQIQSIFIVYAVVLLFLVHYAQYSRSRMEIIAASALIGILFIVILYQYYYLLNRIRSYFTPVIIVYIFQYAQNTDKQSVRVPYSMLIKQFISVIIFIFMLHTNASLYRNEKQMHNHVNEKCTVFDLMGSASVKDVQRKQMRRAEKYWDEDFMKSDENHIQR